MNAEASDRIVIVTSTDGHIVSAGLMSPKAIRKSVEQARLWWLHPETRRVLPFEGYELVSLESGKPWVEAVVRAAAGNAASADEATPSDAENGGDDSRASASAHVPDDAQPANAQQADADSEDRRSSDFGSILVELAQLVHQRNLDRPEGSYTSYLFEEGNEKIRKKTGEEAVELILAHERREIVYEAADLIYHLLVLFEAEGIPVGELLQELASRRH